MTDRAEDANFSIAFSKSIASMFHHPTVGVKVLVGKIDMEHEQSDLHWTMLRRKAFSLSGGLLKTKIVIPDGLVYYSKCYAPGPTSKERAVQIRQGLIGRTGYNENVSELVFDWFGDGDTVQVAVVGKETLREAVDFATPIGLNPVAFSADPDPFQFGSEPFFDKPAEADDGSDSDGEPAAGRNAPGGRESGGWSISALIRCLGKRRDRNGMQFGILSNTSRQAGGIVSRARSEISEPQCGASNLSCAKVAGSFRPPLFGAVRSRTAVRAIVAVLAGTVQIAALASPAASQETTAEPAPYAPMLRPLVLEPPVVLRPHYLGGNSIIASADNAPETELVSELIEAQPEDQLPADIADEVAALPSDPVDQNSSDLESSISEPSEASVATLDLNGTIEETANDAVGVENSAADGSINLPEAATAKQTNPQTAEVALEEAQTIGGELAYPPKRPESISAAVAEYGPPQRPKYIANAPERIHRSTAPGERSAGPPSRPTDLKAPATAYAGSSQSKKGKSNETVASHATETRAIKNARLVLIGVVGKPNQMKALVRLKKGELVSLSVGDSLDGGRVESIHRDHIIYSKGKRTRRLSMPD